VASRISYVSGRNLLSKCHVQEKDGRRRYFFAGWRLFPGMNLKDMKSVFPRLESGSSLVRLPKNGPYTRDQENLS
jgi:hypothetical protein